MNRVIAVCGPTAVGKTKYAIEIAKAFNGEIISCDSMQIYKYMDIGSAKPTKEECSEIKHYLVDEIDPKDEFTVSDYQFLAKKYIDLIFSLGKTPVIEGGTGLYLNSLIYDMDFANSSKDEELRNSLFKEAEDFGPEYVHDKLKALDIDAAERIHPNNVKKVIRAIEAAMQGNRINDFQKCCSKCQDYEIVLIGLTRNREELYSRIEERVDQMIKQGLFDEVKSLLDSGLTESDISMKGIGYKEIISYYNNEITYDESVELIKKNTRHLAKRQLTWFRRYPEMKWFNINDYTDDQSLIEDIVSEIGK